MLGYNNKQVIKNSPPEAYIHINPHKLQWQCTIIKKHPCDCPRGNVVAPLHRQTTLEVGTN